MSFLMFMIHYSSFLKLISSTFLIKTVKKRKNKVFIQIFSLEWSFLEIDNIIKIFSTLILYKPNIKVLNETLVLIQTILDIYLEKQKSLRNDKINISHIGFIFLLLLSEALFLKLSESHQKILSQLNEIFTSDKNVTI